MSHATLLCSAVNHSTALFAKSSAQAASADPLSVDAASDTVVATLRQIAEDFLAHLPMLAAGVLILLVTAVAAHVTRWGVQRLLRPVKARESLKVLVARFALLGLWALGLLVAAMVTFPGLTPSRALAALGLGSIAVGLAFKDIFENLFAGVLILWRFPFENGDFIECDGISGRVVDVTVRNTILRTVRGELVVLPNAIIFKNPVDVLTNRPERRIEVVCGVAYGEDVDASRDVIREAVESCDTVSSTRDVEIFAKEFGSSSIDFEVAWWTGSTPLDQRRSRDQVIAAVKRALDKHGIEIPFPYRTLTFRDDSPLRHLGAQDAE